MYSYFALLMWRKSKILYDISLAPKLFALYWPWKCQISCIYTIEKQRSSLWKTARWNARLIYTINKNNKKHDNIFWKISSKWNNFIYYFIKIFLLYTLNLLPLTFSNFVHSNNQSILWSLRLLLPKASAFAFCCFQLCKKGA